MDTHHLSAEAPPLVIDLDGTLIHSDLLWETLVLFLKQHLLRAWMLPVWLFGGKAAFKDKLARAVEFDASALPYDRALLEHIAAEKAAGRKIVLATGSQRALAEQVAAHLKLFDVVMATEERVNLTSHHKADALVREYGHGGFDYVGNSRVDVPVWEKSRHAYAVTRSAFQLADGRSTTRIGDTRHNWLPALVQALRPRQWLKNLLVFVPMLAGHVMTAEAFMQSVFAFLAFSLCASSAYLLNDTLDAQDDRLHATKHRRPVASGRLPMWVALCASPVLALAALAFSTLSAPLLPAVIGVYFLTTLWYSFQLKRVMMLDIVTLSILYSIRIIGGGVATGIVLSFWLLAFSFFIFLSLAMLKRFSELSNLHRQGARKTRGRGYRTGDAPAIGAMGLNAAMMSVLVLMMYMNSENILRNYRHPELLVGCAPLLVFWLGRLWLLAYRGKVNEDPVLYVSTDRVSLAVFAICALLVATAAVLP